MIIQHNISALNAYRNMQLHQNAMAKSLRRLSSGYRINSAADDAAGLAISERMRGQIRGLNMAARNAGDMISLLQTAEGGLNESHAILHRMRELAVQAANGTYTDEDRAQIGYEYEALKEELDRIARSTHFNGMKLLDGSQGGVQGPGAPAELGLAGITVTGNADGFGDLSVSVKKDGSGSASLSFGGKSYSTTFGSGDTSAQFTLEDGTTLTLNFAADGPKSGRMTNLGLDGAGGVVYDHAIGTAGTAGIVAQVGANGGDDQRIYTAINNMDSESLGVASGNGSVRDSSIADRDQAREAIDVLDKAINQVSGQRAVIGAQINRLHHTVNSLNTAAENLAAAESSIRDVDMAEEMMAYAKATILMQAAQAMMAHAMNAPKYILELLRSL